MTIPMMPSSTLSLGIHQKYIKSNISRMEDYFYFKQRDYEQLKAMFCPTIISSRVNP